MKVAIIELGGSHDECIYSQIKIIKAVEGIHLTLICNDSLKENVKYFDLVDKKIFISLSKGLNQWKDLYRLWLFCKKEKFNKIIFNTAQGKVVKKLLFFPFSKQTKIYGILHNIRKSISSFSQKRISKKVEHYFILNKYLENNIKNATKNMYTYSVFHTIFFPDYPKQDIHKNNDEIWICVPGQVELKRRDYRTLFESIQKYGINENIKFLLLGRYGHAHGDGDYIKHQISNLSIEENFLIWEKFVPVTIFYAMIKNSDYILPLIHEGDVSGDLYKGQISGAYNLAVGYKKPLLVEKAFCSEILDEYNPITYNKSCLMETINQLDKNKSNNYYDNKKWSFDYQKEKYLLPLGITNVI